MRSAMHQSLAAKESNGQDGRRAGLVHCAPHPCTLRVYLSPDHDPGYGNGMIPSRKATNKDAAVKSAEVPGLSRRARSQASKGTKSPPLRKASARTSSATSRPCLRSIRLSRYAATNAKYVATIAASKSPSAANA